ncbi:MAG TPA: helix-hairpin-helix domain-containing protein [Pyrinomonadaceae bacterium]|nr:helix-hairpin-helix domain-containing protein [Pyrinomonadaceae bacterium]
MQRYQLSKAHLTLSSLLALLLINTACVKRTQNEITADPARAHAAITQNSARASLINLNTATARELESLPGIGAALAARIVEHRERYGRFRRAEHLLMVRGISDRRFREMRALITVE